jgi:hypothetical protein
MKYDFKFNDIYSTCVTDDCESETQHHVTMAMNLFIRNLINRGQELEDELELLKKTGGKK